MGPKIENLYFELDEKLDHHFYVEFRDKSNGDGLDDQKPIDSHPDHMVSLVQKVYPVSVYVPNKLTSRAYT